jgi:hypothetical protein
MFSPPKHKQADFLLPWLVETFQHSKTSLVQQSESSSLTNSPNFSVWMLIVANGIVFLLQMVLAVVDHHLLFEIVTSSVLSEF